MPESTINVTLEKSRVIKDFITRFLGHEPSIEEKRRFTIMSRLNESKVYFKGEMVAHLRYHVKENSFLAEYL